jgi:hypothetical protein
MDKNNFLTALRQFVFGVVGGLLLLIFVFVFFYYINEFFSNKFDVDVLGPLVMLFGALFVGVIIVALYLKGREGTKISKEELERQVSGYNNFKITQSYRGILVITFVGLIILSLTIAYFNNTFVTAIFVSIVYLILLFFIYKGHRWAIISLIILWTADKFIQIYNQVITEGGFIFPILFWWLAVAILLSKALSVENEKRKIKNK